MSAHEVSDVWLPVAGWLAVEVVLVAGLLLGASRCSSSPTWRRMYCQAALVAVMVLLLGELSGAARLAAWRLGRLFSQVERKTGAVATLEAPRPAQMTEVSRPRTATVPTTTAEAAGGTPEVATLMRAESTPEPAELPGTDPNRRPGPSAAGTQKAEFPWLGLGWFLGALVIVGRAAAGRGLLLWHGLRRRQITDSALKERVADLAGRLGLGRRVRVLRSTQAGSPMAYGCLCPTVVLPTDFETRFDARQQEVVLAHEVAHLAARDPLWWWLADLAVAPLWWHPAAWWLRRQFHQASESAADEASLLVAGGPKALAECLVELGSRLLEEAPAGHLGMAGFRSHLGRRVQWLLRLEDRPWSPPPRRRAVAVQVFGAAAAVAVVISTTAWASPRAQTQGETMNTMKQNWKKTLAAFGLAAVVATPAPLPAAEPLSVPTPAPLVSPPGPGAPVGTAPAPVPGVQPVPAPAAPAPGPMEPPKLMPEAGLPAASPMPPTDPRNPFGTSGPRTHPGDLTSHRSARAERLEALLSSIVIDAGPWEGLPLSEVIKLLSDQAQRQDRAKVGVNFLLDQRPVPSAQLPGPAIDPATGLPVPAAAMEQVDLMSVAVMIRFPLKNVTLMDLLDAIVKSADHPIRYIVEDYAVVFSLAPPRALVEPDLSVRTFKVEKEVLTQGLQSAFGITVGPLTEAAGVRSRQYQAALRSWLTALNVPAEGNRSVFYNETTSILMVRASPEELLTIKAAVETLGGSEAGTVRTSEATGASGVLSRLAEARRREAK